MGVSPSFFFLGRPSSFFFLMGGFPLDAHRPPTFFFFLGRPSSSYFFDGGFCTVFFNPQKIKSACENFVFAFFYIFYGKKIISRTVPGTEIITCDRRGKIWLLDTFLLLLKQIPFFWKFIRPSFAHLFFFFGAPIFFKKKRWALFFGAHLPPIFFFSRPSFAYP